MNLFDKFCYEKKISPEWLRNGVGEVFSGFVKDAGGLCGILVLLSEDGSSFEEVASWGYEDEGFYYEFMARGAGYFEKLAVDIPPAVFLADSFLLYRNDAQAALVASVPVSSGVAGFLLVEFAQVPQESVKHYFSLFANKLGDGWLAEDLQKGKGGLGATGFLVGALPGLQTAFSLVKRNHPVLISGPVGCGKKTLAKYIHDSVVAEGRLILINTYPDQIVKLEKSVASWSEMSAGGIVVFDKIFQLSLGQQKLFYDFIVSGLEFTPVFIDSLEKKEIFAPFWELIGQCSLMMPALDSVEKNVLEGVVLHFFEELLEANQRRGLVLGKDALSKLKYNSYPENFNDLRAILENAIQNSSGSVLGESELRLKLEMSGGTFDAEDLDLRRCVESLERQKIVLASRLFSGNQIRMAKALGISRGSLQYKMKQMGI